MAIKAEEVRSYLKKLNTKQLEKFGMYTYMLLEERNLKENTHLKAAHKKVK